MLVRILTGLVGIPVFLGLLFLGRWPLLALVTGMGLVAFYEYSRLGRAMGFNPSLPLGGAAVLALLLTAGLMPPDGLYLGAVLALSAMVILSRSLFRPESFSVVDALMTLAGVLYVGLFSHLLLLRRLGGGSGWDVGLAWVGLAFLCTWGADTMAYFVGISLGRHKLAPKISPQKSVEGLLGGVAGAAAVGLLLAPTVGVLHWHGALLGVAIALVATLGDLTESALKRAAGVKDSGRLLPGHGGVLDRFDSSLFVLPFVYYIATLIFGLS
ncbi:phosphatidate cytidylyltransferase [Symbiobacterium terraclitae]|uniref:Phosphatidate cytidylyltransferase n=1 Tax=Symbiobacterium terraclitae TaxID=557451 RepID=A0ABS4JRR7_9FIRM|nr:phosphatidate cytidylyltransferase [Symbiobacterium terraclitae]